MKSTKSLSLFFFSFLILQLNGVALFSQQPSQTGTIKGRLIDYETKSPLAGADVEVLNTQFGAATAKNGYYIIKNVPKEPDVVEFSYYRVAVDKENFLPMEMKFYDKNGKHYRTIESVKIEDIEGFPTVTKSVAKDLDQDSQTEMEFSNVDYNIGIGDIFTERYLRRPPREAIR